MNARLALLVLLPVSAACVLARRRWLPAARSSLRRPPPLATASAEPSTPGMEQVLFVECGFGCDQHGQNATKAVVRACRSAIEFNSIPSIRRLVPGGYENMKLHVQVGVPAPAEQVDLSAVAAVFPYGQLLPIQIEQGGLRAHSGIALPEMGDANDDVSPSIRTPTWLLARPTCPESDSDASGLAPAQMIIAVACVTVGY